MNRTSDRTRITAMVPATLDVEITAAAGTKSGARSRFIRTAIENELARRAEAAKVAAE